MHRIKANQSKTPNQTTNKDSEEQKFGEEGSFLIRYDKSREETSKVVFSMVKHYQNRLYPI